MFVWMHGFPPTFNPQLSHFPTASLNRHTSAGGGCVPRACVDRKTRNAKPNHADEKSYASHGQCCRNGHWTKDSPHPGTRPRHSSWYPDKPRLSAADAHRTERAARLTETWEPKPKHRPSSQSAQISFILSETQKFSPERHKLDTSLLEFNQ